MACGWQFFWLKKWLMGWLRRKNVILRACKLVKKKSIPLCLVQRQEVRGAHLESDNLFKPQWANHKILLREAAKERETSSQPARTVWQWWTSALGKSGRSCSQPVAIFTARCCSYNECQRPFWRAALMDGHPGGPVWCCNPLGDSHRARIFAHRLLHFWSVREGK